jgi:sialate O-acetylesterase
MIRPRSSSAPRASRARILALALAALLLLPPIASAAARTALPELFGDHMVLQRQCRVPVWGTAEPGARVRIAFAGRRYRARAGADGCWSAQLAPLAAGGPHELVVRGPDTLITVRDVMVGEVWLASGQSNMEMPVNGWGQVLDAAAEVAAADHPDIRLFQVGRRVAYHPQADLPGAAWQVCSPRTVPGFSAVAYFFGRALGRELKVPVGLVLAAWGGTEIESWTRAGALAPVPGLDQRLERVAGRAWESPAGVREQFRRATAAWFEGIRAAERAATGAPPWSSPALDESAWRPMTLPCDWENAGLPDLDGVVWFRRWVEVPPAWAGRELALHLGRIDDADSTFFDGVAVGTDSVYDRPREYRVPARLVTPGRHVVAVRVFDWMGGGGLWGEGWRMSLSAGPGDSVALAGEWRWRTALDLATLPPRPRDPDDPGQPGVLADGMIAPLVPYALRGAIWYQGEANVSRAEQYRMLFPAMIADWRRWWGQGPFPFLFVQLAGFMDPPVEPGESDWAELREAQALALASPRTGMAVAVDIGDARDIHPRNKQEVGRRLALAALRVAYGRDTVSEGPRLRALRLEGRTARLGFEGAAGGLRAMGGGAPRGFALAGADRHFHWATARIEGDEIVLWCDAVAAPVAVRYGWAANPGCDLVGGTGLPVAPFRTDDWPGITHGRR